VLSGEAGTGSGSVKVGIAANAGAAPRTGHVTVAGITFTIEQAGAPPCTFVVKPTYYNAGRGPDEVRVDVRAPADCAWAASSSVAWATIAEGRSGKGEGSVRVRVEANDGPARTAILSIAGESFTLSQEGGCEATLKPSYYNAGPGPDDIRIQVKTRDGCSWRSSSPVPWARITEGTAETGNGQVRVQVDRNAGAARSATLLIAGERFMLTQEAHKQ
jgi:Putative binding domain, N-terminal